MRLLQTMVMLACLPIPPSAMALTPDQIFAGAGHAVAILETFDDKEQRLGTHSATIVEGNRLVTSCNVLEMATTIHVTSGSESTEATIIARDRERNLCLVSVPRLKTVPIARHTGPLPVGSKIFALTNALGLGIGISEGIIAGIRTISTGTHIQFSAPISPGSEGGALVDENGRLVGIIDYLRRDGQNVNFALAAEFIDEIERRSMADKARLERFDQAMALLKQQQWSDLFAIASDWSEKEPESSDAWRFVIAAAKKLENTPAEYRGWEALHRIDPSSSEAGIGLGRLLILRGKKDEALDLARQLLSAHQEDATCWLFLGLAQQASGQANEADQSLRRAVDLDPWLIEAYRNIAALAQMRGDSKTAIAIWTRLSGLYPNQTIPLIGLAQAYLGARVPARAWAVLGRIGGKEADSAAVWYWKGVTQARLERPEQSIAAFRKSLDLKFTSADWAWAGIGFALAEMKRFPEAIEAFRSAAQAAPENDEWRYQMAVNLKDGGRANEALAITADLVAKQPEEAKNWRQHGFVLAVLGKAPEAIPAMEKSLVIDPKQAKLWGALTETYQVAGRREDARRAYERLRTIDVDMAEKMYRWSILPYEEGAQ